jgi:hypothetical protein
LAILLASKEEFDPMHTLLNQIGRTGAAAFMAFALVAMAHGAVCVATLNLAQPPTASAAAPQT